MSNFDIVICLCNETARDRLRGISEENSLNKKAAEVIVNLTAETNELRVEKDTIQKKYEKLLTENKELCQQITNLKQYGERRESQIDKFVYANDQFRNRIRELKQQLEAVTAERDALAGKIAKATTDLSED